GLVRLDSANEGHSALPTGRPIELRTLLEDLIELQSPASRRDLNLLIKHTRCPDSKGKLEALAGDDFREKIQSTRTSILDLLEQFPACELPFAVFLETCPNMVPRYYSISSSPKAGADRCTITVAVVEDVARNGHGQYHGVCSNYLEGLKEGDSLHAATRQPSAGFTLPEDPKRPIIMIGPGTGIAPFRGFLQDRAADQKAGTELGPAVLFFGCRHPEQDFIYQEELEAWAKDGVCDLHTAFSRAGKERVYVQDVLRQQRGDVWPLIEAGAKIYVCGDGGHMEPDVRRALTRMYAEEKDVSDEKADEWFSSMIERQDYVMDVWVNN
ncbi:MAG: NADPH--cytochrome reductase, partial [Pseudomonadota bacterium]